MIPKRPGDRYIEPDITASEPGKDFEEQRLEVLRTREDSIPSRPGRDEGDDIVFGWQRRIHEDKKFDRATRINDANRK